MFSFGQGLLCGLGLVSLVEQTTSQTWDGPSPYANGSAPDVIVPDGLKTTFPGFEGKDSDYPALIKGIDGVNASETTGLAARDAKDFYLRILPLGASIVQGVQSSDNNGFRKLLRQQLRWKGWKVNMVGTKNNGNMNDNDNEGHPGWIISQVHDEWSKAAVNGLKPNVVLINAGTNDCGGNVDTANAGARMKDLIDDIYNKLPDVTIVLSTLVKSKNSRACAENLSQQFRDLVTKDYRNKRMGLADIDSIIKMDQLDGDGIHPNDEGYKLFAAVWWEAISRLENEIQPPPTDGLIKDDNATGGANKCPKVAGNAAGPVQTQKGSGHDDGIYKHDRVERGVIESARIQKNNDPKSITQDIPLNMYFADIIKNDPNSDRVLSLDDWIRVFTDVNGQTTYYFRQNLGGGNFGESRTFEPGVACQPKSAAVHFADFNGDGLDDFFCVKADMSVAVSLNRGGSPPKFESIGDVVPAVSGWASYQVSFADIDGDGRADFCLVSRDGIVKCSRNAGQGDKNSWQGFSTIDGIRGTVFDKGSMNPMPLFKFGDINGDYRSDIMMVGDNGNVQTWTNRRGRGEGIVPEWVSSGLTHQGVAESSVRDNIKFGKIYGSNRLDYIYIKNEENWYDVKVYENEGSGGTKLKADGTFYCDMRGTGSDDYVWIYQDGHSNEIFANTHNPPFWDPNYTFTLNVGAPRTLIHLADWTGNGRCDVLVQDKVTSAVTLWENQWNEGTRTLTFANRGVVASPGCGKSTGVSIFDRSMRIADMDGDGRADVVCLELGGKLTSWLNTKDGMKDVGQIKLTEGWDRANLRLADVENSGRADIIWLNKYTGAGSVWKNNGYAGPNGGGGGSSFSWTKRDVLYSPIDRGEVMNFANLGGLGRADLIQVYPDTNEAYTFFNKCPGGAGGDDGDITDPQLPEVDIDLPPRGDGDYEWPDGFPTAEHWIALGDSYSAGVGAGSVLDNPRDPGHNCLTTSGSYPKRLEQRYQELNEGLEFLSCTGDVISNVNEAGSHGRATQLEIMSGIPKGSYNVSTLSIGGNDLGFSSIVKNCIILGSILGGDCEEALKNAESIAGITPRDSAKHAEVFAAMQKVYRDILDTAGDGFTLVVTGYARFFAQPQGNTDCDNGQMQLAAVQDIPGGSDTRPSLPLKVELRDRINGGVDAFNSMIRAAISEVEDGLKRDEITAKRIKFVDINPVFEGHRFCEKGDSSEVGWPEFTDRAWFFSSPFRSDILPSGRKVVPRADDGSPRLQLDRRDSEFCDSQYNVWDCTLGELQARDPDMPLNEKEYPKGRSLADLLPDVSKAMIMKAFHPKTIAYDAIAKLIAGQFGEGNGQDPQDPDIPQDPEDMMDYFVWPEDGRDTKQVEEIASSLQRYVGTAGELETSNTETFGLNYWRIRSLTVEQAYEISNITNVASINQDCGSCITDDPTTATVYQEDALAQLRYISNKPDTPQDPNRYYFDESGGEGIKVYVVDTGAAMDHPEFERIRSRTRWIQVGKGDEAKEDDCKAHGTSMLSLVAGINAGVAKNIDPIIVRMPCRGKFVAMKGADYIDGLSMVNDELDESSPTVVLMAVYWTTRWFKGPNGEVSDVYWQGFFSRYLELLESLASKGAILVTGTGNENEPRIHGVPASYGKPGFGDLHVPSLLVMGGVSPDGTIAYGNTEFDAGLPHAYAPGFAIRAADSDKSFWPDNDMKNTAGTSCSAAFTAGLAAYYLRMSQLGATIDGQQIKSDPQSMKDFIVGGAWSRGDIDGRPRPGVWNKVDVPEGSQWQSRNSKRAATLFGRKYRA